MRFILFFICLQIYLYANGHIFVYHRFDDPRYKSADTTTKQLIEQFEYFKNNNYKVVSLSEIYTKLKNKESIPSNWVALTIDDAYKSFYQNGLKIFKKYNYPFTLFVYTKATNTKYGDFMTWDMLKEASQYGEIALHSHTHPHLTYLTNKEVYQDTKQAYNIFEKNMGYKPKYYAYPYGEFNQAVENEVKKFNFDMILNQNSGSLNKNTNINSVNRVALVGKVNIKQKLKYKTLNVKWIEPIKFPDDGMLQKIEAQVSKDIKTIKLYITGEGWVDLKVKDGIISHKLNVKLKRSRTRIILSTDHYNIATKIIIKKRNKNGK